MKTLIAAASLMLLPSIAFAAVGKPPPMSKADKAQMQEDMKIISPRVKLDGDSVTGRADRLASCRAYWGEKLHHDRHHDARKFLYAIRVARCMFVQNWTIVHGPCKPYKVALDDGWRTAIQLADHSRCYVKFSKVLPQAEEIPAE